MANVYQTCPRRRARQGLCVRPEAPGQAGAIDFFGPRLGLPKAISGHNSYYFWGPRDCSGDVLIVIGDNRTRLDELFERVELGATYHCADCMPYEATKSVWVARKLRRGTPQTLWPQVRDPSDRSSVRCGKAKASPYFFTLVKWNIVGGIAAPLSWYVHASSWWSASRNVIARWRM